MNAQDHLTIMRVRGNLIAVFPPHPSDSTISELQERVLRRIEGMDPAHTNGIVLDVGSVQTVDSFFARMIIETAKMVELMGVRPVLVGISPAVAITVTELGFSLGEMDTALSTDAALDMLSDDLE